MNTKIVSAQEAVALEACTIGEYKIMEKDCWTLVDIDGDVLLYEEKAVTVPFSGVQLVVKLKKYEEIEDWQVTAIII